jgi:hypothetical protein
LIDRTGRKPQVGRAAAGTAELSERGHA